MTDRQRHLSLASREPAPTVSVGLPVYNGARYLRHAIESLLAQTYRDMRQPLRAVQTLNNAHLVHKGTASTYFLLGESYAELDRDLPAGEDLLLLQARPETVHSVSTPVPAVAAAGTTSGFSGLGSITSALLRSGAKAPSIPQHHHTPDHTDAPTPDHSKDIAR